MTIRDAILANPAATDTQILALLQNKATERPIDRPKLSDAARKSGAIVRLRGVLATGTAAQKAAAQEVLDLITYGDDVLRTDVPGSNEFGVLSNPAGLNAAERSAVVAMAGGLRFAATTAADVGAERAAMTRGAALDHLRALNAARRDEAQAEPREVIRVADERHNTTDSLIADVANDPTRPVPATLAELEG